MPEQKSSRICALQLSPLDSTTVQHARQSRLTCTSNRHILRPNDELHGPVTGCNQRDYHPRPGGYRSVAGYFRYCVNPADMPAGGVHFLVMLISSGWSGGRQMQVTGKYGEGAT